MSGTRDLTAESAQLTYQGTAAAQVAGTASFRLVGPVGNVDLNVVSGEDLSDVAQRINAASATTGAATTLSGDDLIFQTGDVGSSQSVNITLQNVAQYVSVAGVNGSQVSSFQVLSTDPDSVNVLNSTVTQSATRGQLTYTGLLGATTASADFTLTGELGSASFSVSAFQSLPSVRDAINAETGVTGISATVSGSSLLLTSNSYGSAGIVSVDVHPETSKVKFSQVVSRGESHRQASYTWGALRSRVTEISPLFGLFPGILSTKPTPRSSSKAAANPVPNRSVQTLAFRKRAAAYAVHGLTASGIVPAAFAVMEVASPSCDPRVVFLWLLLTTLIDAIDGPLARRFHVKHYAANIDGRTIDDLLDYLTFAFIPLLLIWRMAWLPSGLGWTVVFAMGASLFGFAHIKAKDEVNGLFRGFPSYWNAFALYAGIFSVMIDPWLTAIALWILTVLTVAPVWVIYPNLAPQKWRSSVMIGAGLWTIVILAMLWYFPRPPIWLLVVSLVYPVFYVVLSWHCNGSRQNRSS